jgi:chromosome segregation ATPase
MISTENNINTLMPTKRDEIGEIHRKLSALEAHIINMIIPLQNLSQYVDPHFINVLKNLTQTPLRIDDAGLNKTLATFQELMSKFAKGTWAVDPDKVYDKLDALEKKISNFTYEIENLKITLRKLEKESAKQKVFVNISGVECNTGSQQLFSEEQEKFLSHLIWDEETTVRLANLLHKHKLKTWRDVWCYGKVNFYKLERFGKKAIMEIEEVFNRYDLIF